MNTPSTYLHDRVVGGDVDAIRLQAELRGGEQCLRATETLVTNGDNLNK